MRPLLAVEATSTSPELSAEDDVCVEDELAVQGPTESLMATANQEQERQITSVVEANPTAAADRQPPQQEPMESGSLANQVPQMGMHTQIADYVGSEVIQPEFQIV